MITASPAHHMMSSPTRIVFLALDFHGSARSRTYADTTLDLPAYKRMYLARGWMLKGSREKGSWSYPRSPVLAHPSVAPVAPSSSAGASCQHDTERDALRDYKATSRLLDAPRAYDLTPDAPALSFLDACVALVGDDSLRTAAGYATLLPSVGPAASIPHRIRCFARHPPETTISGTAPLSSPPKPVPLAQCLSRAPRIPCVRSAYRRSPSFPSHSSLPSTPRPDSTLTSRRLCLRASLARCTRPPACPAPATAVLSRGHATRCLRARCDVFGTIPLQACIRHSAEIRRAQPQRRLQHLQHRLPVACVTFVASPHAATVLVRAHRMRQSFPIPSAPFSASLVLRPFSPLQAPSIACAAPPICTPTVFSHRRRLSYPCRDDPLRHPKLDTTHIYLRFSQVFLLLSLDVVLFASKFQHVFIA
ncbi:hypothetical protein B0H14DRAFT_3904938 [Mycena olivaceomarginata]|nr:hypothetical protein B0H14DRAFT_3904938 [Mycena olivaceomarginata]